MIDLKACRGSHYSNHAIRTHALILKYKCVEFLIQVLNVGRIKFVDTCLILPTANLVPCQYFRLNSNCILFVSHSPKFSPPTAEV